MKSAFTEPYGASHRCQLLTFNPAPKDASYKRHSIWAVGGSDRHSSCCGYNEVITCYGHDGSAWANNTRCPGSDACGGVDATCLSNRLYHKLEDRPGPFIRGLCAVKPWTKAHAPRFANTACLMNYNNRHSYPISTAQPWGTTLRAKPFFPTLTSAANAVDAKDEVRTDKSARRFPRVTISSDGSFCSDKDGIACCGQKKANFWTKTPIFSTVL